MRTKGNKSEFGKFNRVVRERFIDEVTFSKGLKERRDQALWRAGERLSRWGGGWGGDKCKGPVVWTGPG